MFETFNLLDVIFRTVWLHILNCLLMKIGQGLLFLEEWLLHNSELFLMVDVGIVELLLQLEDSFFRSKFMLVMLKLGLIF